MGMGFEIKFGDFSWQNPCLVFAVLFCAPMLWAADRPVSVELTKDPPELLAKIKHRQYPGGIDEEDLQVQQHLVRPQRKILPVQEEEEDLGGQD